MAREMVKTHDIVFSIRPKTTAPNIFLYGRKDVGFAPYEEYWRHARMIFVLDLLRIQRVQSFQFVSEEEFVLLINKIHHPCIDEERNVEREETLEGSNRLDKNKQPSFITALKAITPVSDSACKGCSHVKIPGLKQSVVHESQVRQPQPPNNVNPMVEILVSPYSQEHEPAIQGMSSSFVGDDDVTGLRYSGSCDREDSKLSMLVDFAPDLLLQTNTMPPVLPDVVSKEKEISDNCVGRIVNAYVDESMFGQDLGEPTRMCDPRPNRGRQKHLDRDAKLDDGGLGVPTQLGKRILADEYQLQPVKIKKGRSLFSHDDLNAIPFRIMLDKSGGVS
ncbi:hypothetical protein ACOSP7_025240 [Xanthoceras sorbifolium]